MHINTKIDTKIAEKIQKLLALSKSSNKHEAQLAMLKAQELLAKHKLSLKEVSELKIYNKNIQDKISKISFKKAKWKAELADVIADNYGCYCYYKTNKTHYITFFGREEDTIICSIVLEYAIDCINSIVKKIKYEYIKKGYRTKGLESDYAMGFILGLKEKFEEQKKKHQEWGLVLVKDVEVINAYKEKKFKGTINIYARYNGNFEVYKEGYENGKKFSITDKIEEGQTEEILSLVQG